MKTRSLRQEKEGKGIHDLSAQNGGEATECYPRGAFWGGPNTCCAPRRHAEARLKVGHARRGEARWRGHTKGEGDKEIRINISSSKVSHTTLRFRLYCQSVLESPDYFSDVIPLPRDASAT